MKLVPKKQIGGSMQSAGFVNTPTFTPIAMRTFFLEAKRKKLLPQELKYTDFIKTPEKFSLNNLEYKFDSDSGQFMKNFPTIQITPEDKTVFAKANVKIDKGKQIKQLLKK